MEPSIVSQKICEIIAEVLGHPPDEVLLEHRLMEDLGAESLDYLDIVFRIEDEFDIQIPRGDIEKSARGELSEEEFAPDGMVSDAGLARLRELLPESKESIQPGLRASAILSLFTVQTFAKIVIAKLG